MITPEIKFGLDIGHGSSYGLEEFMALRDCLNDMAPSHGKKVVEFENKFAAYCGTKYASAVTSATTGLTLAGIAVGVGKGVEVITTPNSWVATAFAFSQLGAKMVFCDVNPRTLCLDSSKLEVLITEKTRAIVPVHLYGQCCEMDKIMEIAKKYDVPVIEDCAHSVGGSYDSVKAGALGDIGVFSFHQQKNMCTLGEGGMVTTNNDAFHERVYSYRSLCCRNYGMSDKYLSINEEKYPMGKNYWKLMFDDFGYNFRMTDAQGAVGIEQLKKLDDNNDKRRHLSERLTEKLQNVPNIILPYVDLNGIHVWHLYMIQLTEDAPISKEDFMWQLYTQKGIKIGTHYMPIHLTDPYIAQGHKVGECPVCEEASKRYMTLPMNPRLTNEAIDYMADCIHEIMANTYDS
jgi:dTDP-4-amino-4,6-dideoxygalactose transaminase